MKPLHLKLQAKLLIASRNGKGAVAFPAFKSNRLSDAFSFMGCHFWHETDMHPIDLIRDSSMTGYAEILTGEPDAKINLQGRSN